MSGTRLARSLFLPSAFAVAGAWLILFSTAPYGPGASADSVTYVSVARSLAAGEGWVRFDGEPYASWPPLYPAALAAGIRGGAPPLASARGLQALAFGVTLLALVSTLLRVTGSAAWAALGGLLVLTPRALTTYASIWSEGSFAALAAGAVWLAVRSESEPRTRDVVGLGLLCAAACLTRYLGVALVAALGLWLLVGTGGDWNTRLRRLAGFAAIALLPVAVWMLRNLAQAGSALGQRRQGYATFSANSGQFAENLGSYLNLQALGVAGGALAAALFAGVAIGALVFAGRSRPRRAAAAWWVPASFILIYSALLIGLASWTPVALLSRARFATPVWIPFVLLTIASVAAAWQRWPARGARVGIALLLALVVTHGLQASFERVARFRSQGVHSLMRAEWHDSALIDAVRSRAGEPPLLTNRPHTVHLHTWLPTTYAPRRHAYRSDEPLPDQVAHLSARVAAEGSVPIAWFHDYRGGYGFYTPQELAGEKLCMLVVERFGDGVLVEAVDERGCGTPGAATRRIPAPPAPR